MRTPSCIVGVDVLLNGQALSTQAQRNPLTHFAICPLLVLLLSIPSITYLRALAELSSRCFQVPTLLPFPMSVHTQKITTGQYSPNFTSKFRTQIRHGGEPTMYVNKIILSKDLVSRYPNQTEDVCHPVINGPSR